MPTQESPTLGAEHADARQAGMQQFTKSLHRWVACEKHRFTRNLGRLLVLLLQFVELRNGLACLVAFNLFERGMRMQRQLVNGAFSLAGLGHGDDKQTRRDRCAIGQHDIGMRLDGETRSRQQAVAHQRVGGLGASLDDAAVIGQDRRQRIHWERCRQL